MKSANTRFWLGGEIDPALCEKVLAASEGALPYGVEDHVVGIMAGGEVLGGIVDDPIGT